MGNNYYKCRNKSRRDYKKVYIIDYYDIMTNYKKRRNSKNDNTPPKPNCNFRFSGIHKIYLASRYYSFVYLIFTEAWDISGEKVSLPFIELYLE